MGLEWPECILDLKEASGCPEQGMSHVTRPRLPAACLLPPSWVHFTAARCFLPGKVYGVLWDLRGLDNASMSTLAFSVDPKSEHFQGFHIRLNSYFRTLVFVLSLEKAVGLHRPSRRWRVLRTSKCTFPVIRSETGR